MHKQTCIKVNAWVDEKIAPIIEALSQIEGLETFESCQELYPNQSSILFTYGWGEDKKDWQKLGNVCNKMAEALRHFDAYESNVALEWRGSNDQPWGELVINPTYVDKALQAICSIVAVLADKG